VETPALPGTIQGVEVSWDRPAELFALDPTVHHLNHGSFGAVPIPVQRAQQRLRDEMDANPMAFFTRGLSERLGHTRRHLAAFLGADPGGTALVPNASAAIAIVLGSLGLVRGDEILLTNHGYGTVPLAAERLGLRVTEVEFGLAAGDDEVVAAVLDAVRPGRTRLAVVDQITSPTAKLLPVARIANALRERAVPLMVDGAHVPGTLPVDVSSVDADFWLGNLHKWAFAPRPTAVLVVRPEYRAGIQPLVVSWEQPNGFPDSVEFGGTLDYTGWLAAPTGTHLLRTLGADRVRQHNSDLAEYGRRVVTDAIGTEPLEAGLATPTGMRLVRLPDFVSSQRAATELRQRVAVELGCEIAANFWSGHAYLRLSAQIYNRAEQYERLADGLPAVLARARSSGRPTA
jgi:isopenicillin-N epimerase